MEIVPKATVRTNSKKTAGVAGEDALIARVRRALPSRPGAELRAGIGDDAAVIRPARGQEWVVSSDAFIEDVHFLVGTQPGESVGYKALARATSDLAAMGARPRFFLLNLALPRERTGRWLDACLRGMATAARRFRMKLAGGDTARSRTIALNLTVLGEVARGRAVLRSGARPGDRIFVTGKLGAAQLGLEIVLHGLAGQARWRKLLAAHYYPEPPIALGQWLARCGLASAMMDLSDGLSTDLTRLYKASGVGARIQASQLPMVKVPHAFGLSGIDPPRLALHGGEDYQLLFTVPARSAGRVPARRDGVDIVQIGEIVRGRGIELATEGGKSTRVVPKGWDHFGRRATSGARTRSRGPDE
jgi:thiamine-monophosphate kinase